MVIERVGRLGFGLDHDFGRGATDAGNVQKERTLVCHAVTWPRNPDLLLNHRQTVAFARRLLLMRLNPQEIDGVRLATGVLS